MSWSSRPFARIFFFLVAGIFLARYATTIVFINSNWLLFIALPLMILIFLFIKWKISWKWRSLTGIAAGVTIFLFGVWLTRQKLEKAQTITYDKPAYFQGEVIKEPVLTDRAVKLVISLVQLDDTSSHLKEPVKMMALFSRDSTSEKLGYGDQLLFYGKPVSPKPPKNPFEFDYAGFLRLNEISSTVFITRERWVLKARAKAWLPKVVAGKLRNYLLETFKESGLKGNNYAVTVAMILGYDELMEPEVEQDFVRAGAMHVLCVSGLHVGVIYIVMNFLLGFLKRNRRQRFLKAGLLLFFVWFYALLTGLSPSVQRASFMLTIFIVGNAVQRDRDSLNTLAASAVVLLILNPLLIFNVGFQLSYSAVLAIVLLHRPIYNLLYFKNKLVDKIWSVSVLSLVAQLGTFPIAAHYFHFFPTYFWLTNLFVMPLSFLIITTGFLFVMVSWIPFVGLFVGEILSFLVYFLNLIVGAVEYLPYSGLDKLYFPWVKVGLVYLLTGMLFQWIVRKRIRFMLPVLGVALILLIMQSLRMYDLTTQKKLIVYQVSQHSSIAFIEGRKQICLMDTLLLKDQQKANYQMANSEVSWGLTRNPFPIDSHIQEDNPDLYVSMGIGSFSDFRFAVFEEKVWSSEKHTPKIKLDALILRGRKKHDLTELKQCFEFDLLVLDGSVPSYRQKTIMSTADSLGISCYSTALLGAWVRDL